MCKEGEHSFHERGTKSRNGIDEVNLKLGNDEGMPLTGILFSMQWLKVSRKVIQGNG